MLYLLHDFVSSARQNGTRPLLLLIPDVNSWKGGRKAAAYEGFLRETLASATLDLPVIDIASVPFDEDRFSVAPFAGHPSAYGNGIIAEAILPYLEALNEAQK